MSGAIQKIDSAHATEIMTVESTDGSKNQIDHEQARQLAAQYDPNSPEERKLVRKLDWRLVVSIRSPCLSRCKEAKVKRGRGGGASLVNGVTC